MWRGKTAASDLFLGATGPRNFHVLPQRGKLHKRTASVKERLGLLGAGETDGNDAGKMPRPFAPGKVMIVAGGDQVTTLDVGGVYPIFILQDVVRPPAAKAAVENVVATLDGLTSAFADNGRARAKLFAQNSDAADFCFRGDLMDDARDGGAVTEEITTLAGGNHELDPVLTDLQVIGQLEAGESRM